VFKQVPMPSHARRLTTSLCFLAVLTAGSGNAVADTTVATVPNPSAVSIYNGRLAWSSFDPARHGFVLMTHSGGVTTTVPGGTRSVPFDVDLGPDRNGQTVAVYSRCRRDPDFTTAIGNVIINQFPDWRSGRGCDLHKFDFDTGRETRVRGASSKSASEFLPTIWRTRIAFARVYERRAGRAGRRAYLYYSSTAGSGHAKHLPAGPRATDRICTIRRGKRMCRVPVELGPTALDLRFRQLAFSWVTNTGGSCNSTSGVWIAAITGRPFGGKRSRVQIVCSGDIQAIELLSPTLASARVHYGLAAYGNDTFSRIRRYQIATHQTEELAVGTSNVLLSTATDAGTTVYLVSGGYEPGCASAPRVIEPGVGPDTGPCPLIVSPG
jgi:hypothetical protein